MTLTLTLTLTRTRTIILILALGDDGTNAGAKDIRIINAWMALFVGFVCAVASLELGRAWAK